MKISTSTGLVLYVRSENLEDAIEETLQRLQNLNQTGVLLDDQYIVRARFGVLPGGVIGLTERVTENKRYYEMGDAHRAYKWAKMVSSKWTAEEQAHYLEGFEGRPYTGD
jgi:hypothetical protein